MQALVLADVNDNGLKYLLRDNPDCMIQIDGVSLIERMLKQLDQNKIIDRIILIVGNNKDVLIETVQKANFKTEIIIIENREADKTGSIYSVILAKDYLTDDTIVLNSQLIMEDRFLDFALEKPRENYVFVDTHKSWMTGKYVSVDDNGQLLSVDIKSTWNQEKSWQMIGSCYLTYRFIEKIYIPVLETMIGVLGSKLTYYDPLNAIVTSNAVMVKAKKMSGIRWREIHNAEDVNQASILFSKNEEKIVDEMLGSWGGYWRYPDYLDYFYLVTPYYPPRELVEELQDKFKDLLEQYPSGMKVNADLAASMFGISPEKIIIGNGAAELIKSMMGFISGKTGFIRPTFDEYPNRYTAMDVVNFNVKSEDFSYTANDIMNYFENKKISNLVLVNPDNPSGNYIPKNDMLNLILWARNRGIKVIIDESFVDFTDELNPSLIDQEILNMYPNLYVIKSISKSYGVPGLRLGVLASGDEKLIARMKKDVSIWNINSFAEFYMQICGKYRGDYNIALETFRKERSRFGSMLEKVNNIRVIPSQANYFMIELLNGIDAEELKRKMMIEKNVFIKTLSKKIKGNRQFLRIAIRNEVDNDLFIQKFAKTISEIIDSKKGKEINV